MYMIEEKNNTTNIIFCMRRSQYQGWNNKSSPTFSMLMTFNIHACNSWRKKNIQDHL